MRSLNPEKPQNCILTLKNLYRLLTQSDYPAFSYPVFHKKRLQGQTLIKFWSELFQEALPAEVDLSIFDLSLTRNRSLTRLMNRTGGASFYDKWYSSLSSVLNSRLLLALVHAWSRRLELWHYSPQSLTRRLQLFMEEIADAEDLGSEELTSFFREILLSLDSRNTGTVHSGIPLQFRHSFVLSWFTLYALYGCRMQDMHLNRLRTDTGSGLIALYQNHLQQKTVPSPSVLTTRQCLLCTDPLPSSQYIGNQALLSRAAELLLSGHHRLAVSGIGGIGKSEFVRQLLAKLTGLGLYSRLAFIQYEHSLKESVRKAFPSDSHESDDEYRRRVWKLLEGDGSSTTLLLIDHIDSIPAEDPDLNDLSLLKCDMIVTTRLSGFDSFSVISLSGLSAEDSRRLFCTHYPAASAQRQETDALCSSVAGHPMAITLLANICRTRFWTVEKLSSRIREFGLTGLSFVRQAMPVRLEDVLFETFSTSRMNPQQSSVLHLLALLPSRSWLPEDLLPFAADICSSSDALANLCQMLSDRGWLQVSAAGYSIHPLIAKTLCIHTMNANRYPMLMKLLSGSSESENSLFHQAVRSMLPKLGVLNRDAVVCLSALEKSLPFATWYFIPERLCREHRRYLDTHEHTPQEEVDYWLGLALRDIIQLSRTDRLSDCLHAMLPSLQRLPHPQPYLLPLCIVLEQACGSGMPDEPEQILRIIQPRTAKSPDTAFCLITSAAIRQTCSRDSASALELLDRADQLAKELHLTSSLLQARLNYHRAVCLLKQNHPFQSRDLLRSCLSIMQTLSYPDDCFVIMKARTAYAFTLRLIGEDDAALREYKCLSGIYQKQYRRASREYAAMRGSMAMTLLHAGRIIEAQNVIMDIMNQQDSFTDSDLGTLHRIAAEILCASGEYSQARIHAEKAVSIQSRLSGTDSPRTADAQAVFAYVLFFQGETQRANELMDAACRKMAETWEPWHHILAHDLELRSKIQKPSAD